jgi:hypothetical protein
MAEDIGMFLQLTYMLPHRMAPAGNAGCTFGLRTGYLQRLHTTIEFLQFPGNAP